MAQWWLEPPGLARMVARDAEPGARAQHAGQGRRASGGGEYSRATAVTLADANPLLNTAAFLSFELTRELPACPPSPR